MARTDFLDISTPITSVNVLEKKEFNIALAYDLDFKMPKVVFEKGQPKLEKVEGHKIFVLSYFNGQEWDYSCIVFMRNRLMNKDIGPEQPIPMLTTLYSCNFNKLPCSHQIKRFGDWLNSIDSKTPKYYGFEFIMAKDGIYYNHIETDCNKVKYKPIKKCIMQIAKDGKLTRGFVAAVTVLDSRLNYNNIEVAVSDKINGAFKYLYECLREKYDRSFVYRTDGGGYEGYLHMRLQEYAVRRKSKNAAKTATV